MKQKRPLLLLLWYLPLLVLSGGYTILYWTNYSEALSTQYNPTYAVFYQFLALPLLICSATGLIVGIGVLLLRVSLSRALRQWFFIVPLTVFILYFLSAYLSLINIFEWSIPDQIFPLSVRMLLIRVSGQWFFFAIMGAFFALGAHGKGQPA